MPLNVHFGVTARSGSVSVNAVDARLKVLDDLDGKVVLFAVEQGVMLQRMRFRMVVKQQLLTRIAAVDELDAAVLGYVSGNDDVGRSRLFKTFRRFGQECLMNDFRFRVI